MGEISFLLAFGYGLVSFFSPCTLPLVPIYLANLGGHRVPDTSRRRWSMFLHSLSFVVGFSLVFTVWGAGAGLIGSYVVPHLALVRQIAGGILIAFGIIMLASLRVPWLNYERRLRLGHGGRASFARSFLIGAVFPVAWTPCASWVLGSILVLAGASETAMQGAFLLATYSLGLGLPFLAAGIALDFLSPVLKGVARYGTTIFVVSGVLLIAVGILILADRLAWLTGRI